MAFKSSEIAVLIVNGQNYTDFESVEVTHRAKEFPFFMARFTTSEGVPFAKNFAAMQIRPGDFCSITLGGEIAFNGKVETRQAYVDARRHHVEIICVTRMEVATSSVISQTMQWHDKTFGQIARDILGKMGIPIKFVGGPEPTFKFPRASAEHGQSVLSFLDELSRGLPAEGVGLSFSNDVGGSFLVVMGPIPGDSNDAIVEGQNALILREVWYNIAQSGDVPALGHRPGDDDLWGAAAAHKPFSSEALQTFGESFTPRTIVNEIPAWSNSVLRGRVGNESQWSQSDLITCTVTVQGWMKPSGGLWERGKDYSLTSPMLIMDRELLTAKVIVFSQDNTTGTRTTLTLCNKLALGGDIPPLGKK